MTAQELAKQILQQIDSGERKMFSPHILKWITLTNEEAEILGVKAESTMFKPHLSYGELSEIAKSKPSE